MKKFKDWKDSNLLLDQFLTPGDEVDEEFFGYFCSVLPPAMFVDKYVQIGEPHDYVHNCRTKKVEPTYLTICNGFYCGKCFLGESLNVEGEIE